MNKERSIILLDHEATRYPQYLADLIPFYSTFKQNRRTIFYQIYPSFKYTRDGQCSLLLEFIYSFQKSFSKKNRRRGTFQEQIALHILHNSFNAHDSIVGHCETGNGIHFRLKGHSIERFPDGEKMRGSVMLDKYVILGVLSVTKGIFLICALNCILGLNHPNGQSHFLTYIEKEILQMHRVIHSPLTLQLKKVLNWNKKPKIRSSALDDIEQ